MNYTVKHIHGDLNYSDCQFILNHNLPISIDTETTGLDARQNQLKLIQIGLGNLVYIIRFYPETSYENLSRVINSGKLIYFHNATFDVKFLIKNLPNLVFQNIICTKITAKIINGATETSSLKPLLKKYCNISLDKAMQSSNWGNDKYSEAQIEYAARDVLFLPMLYSQMEPIINERKLHYLLKECYEFVPIQAYLELFGHENIFKY